MSTSNSGPVWFTVKEKRWKIGFFGKFSWTGKEQLWDSDNCTVSIARTLENKCLIAVRSNQSKYSCYMQKEVMLRYMLGFEISKTPSKPCTETYTVKKPSKKGVSSKERWVLQLDDKHWLWEWTKEGVDIVNSRVYQLYCEIVEALKQFSTAGDNMFRTQNAEASFDEVLPVIYQPSIDSLKNFVREVHCAKYPTKIADAYTIEVSIVFNNERLRQHGIFNSLYECIRRLIYGRTVDIETFKIHVTKNPANKHFTFEGIYSDKHEINADSIHGDKKQPPPNHSIKYYFTDQNHPIIFVNTSNHAMAEHDTNNKLWKWEYIPWLTDTPIKLGTLTRKEIEEKFKDKK